MIQITPWVAFLSVLVLCGVVVALAWWVDWRGLRRLRRMEIRQELRGVEHEKIEHALDRIEIAVGNAGPAAIVGAFARHLDAKRKAELEGHQPGDVVVDQNTARYRDPEKPTKPGQKRPADARAML